MNQQNLESNESECEVKICERLKKRNPEMWKSNIRKRKRACGEEYVITANKVVVAKKAAPDCACRKNISITSVLKCEQLLEKFNKLGDTAIIDYYLAGLITPSLPSRPRRRPRDGSGKAKSYANKYKVRVGINVFDACQKAFCSIHGISRKRVELIAKHLTHTSDITSPQDRRSLMKL